LHSAGLSIKLDQMVSRASLLAARTGGRNVAIHVGVVLAVAVIFSPVVLNPTDVLYSPVSDVLSAHHPFRTLQVESLHERGRPQLWNATSFGGMPLVGDPQAGIFYPMNWLHALAPTEASHAWFGWGVVLHLIIGGWGMLAWLSGHGFSRWPRLAGALAFIFAGKWVLHIAVPAHIIMLPLVWLPWQCFFIDRVLRGPDTRNCVGLAIATALVVTGLHPQLLLYSQMEILGYGLLGCVVLWRDRGTGRAARVLLAAPLALLGTGILALGLCAAHLIPIIGHMDFYVRSEGVSYGAAAVPALTWDLLPTLLIPASSLVWEPSVHIGVAALVLGGLALWQRPTRPVGLYCLASVVLILWYATGAAGGLHRLLYDTVPGFSLFRIPTRMLLLIGFPMGYLVAAGVETLVRSPIRWSLAGAAIGLAITAAFVAASSPEPESWFSALALCLPGLALAIRYWGPATWVAPLLVFGLFLDQARYAIPLIRTLPVKEALGDSPLVERLTGPLGKQRVLSINRNAVDDLSPLPGTYATPAGIEGMRGFNPLVPRATARLLLEGVGRVRQPRYPAITIVSFPLRKRAPLDLFNIRWITSVAPIDLAGVELREEFSNLRVYHFELASTLSRLNRVYLYENTRALPRVALVPRARFIEDQDRALDEIGKFDPRQEVLIEHPGWTTRYPGPFRAIDAQHEGDRIRLDFDAKKGGYLVVSEVWYPGWQARVDGQARKIERANGFFQALQVGPGRHEILLEYWPVSLSMGLWISALSLGVVVLLLTLRGLKSTADHSSR
jgi:hypothetical protein